MAYDKKLISQILHDMELSRERHKAEAEERRHRLEQIFPRLSQINRELRMTSARALRIAFESNDTDSEIAALRRLNLDLQEEKRLLLQRNGYPSDYLTILVDCPICHDSGYNEQKLCSCVLRKAAAAQNQALSSLLPVDKQTFDTFQMNYYSNEPDSRFGVSPRQMAERNYRACSSFSELFGEEYENLLLYGSTGLGKTFLSSCIARRLTQRGFSVAYDTATSIFDNYNSVKFSSDNAESQQALERYRRADLLIMDDLGTEMPTPFHTSCLYDLISYRLMRSMPMIINTNLLPKDLEERYSPAIASRILGEFTQLRFFGEDIRKIRKKQRF